MSETSASSPIIMASRFSGELGKQRLMEILCDQFIVRGENPLASALASVSELIEYKSGDTIIEQGNSDNDIFLIISGALNVFVNQRMVGERKSGMHVGEMAIIDSTSRRSSTVTAREDALVAKINHDEFEKITKEYPQIWKRLAIELSRRLKERNKFHTQPRSQPVVFIGSTDEGVSIAQKIGYEFVNDPFVVKVWNQGVFNAGNTTIEDLVNVVSECDFGVVVITPDDKVISRKKKYNAPRDNVIFELGLLIGAVGRQRTFIVRPKRTNIKIPSDLLGVTTILYEDIKPSLLSRILKFNSPSITPLQSEISTVSNEIRNVVKKKGPI